MSGRVANLGRYRPAEALQAVVGILRKSAERTNLSATALETGGTKTPADLERLENDLNREINQLEAAKRCLELVRLQALEDGKRG